MPDVFLLEHHSDQKNAAFQTARIVPLQRVSIDKTSNAEQE
jgi:hypothetical protein